MNKIFEIKELQPNNRSLYSVQVVKPAQKLIECQALALATLKSQKGTICNWCLMKKDLFRCSQCKSFYYCSKECQKNDWSIHKHECKIYQNMTNVKNLSVHNQITTQFVLNLRIALLLKHHKQFEAQFMKMVSLHEHQPPEKMQNFQQLAVVILQNMGDEKNENNISKMMRQLNIVAVNAFTIQDFLCETDGVAIGIYSPANYINHDCQPNCTQYFDGRYLNIVANKQIPAKQQICISYTNPLALAKERKQFLRQNYLFECFCELCQVETMVDTKYKYVLCQNCHGQMEKKQDQSNEIIYSCIACDKKYYTEQMETRMKQIQTMIINYKQLDTNQYIRKSFFMLKKILSFNHPFFAQAIDKAYHSTINTLFTAPEDKKQKLMEEAYILLKQQVRGIPNWYRLDPGQEKSIRFFLKYAQLGKICFNLNKLQKAYQYTEIAYEIIKKIYLKNKYQEVLELQKRFQEITIQLSMAKAHTFSHS